MNIREVESYYLKNNVCFHIYSTLSVFTKLLLIYNITVNYCIFKTWFHPLNQKSQPSSEQTKMSQLEIILNIFKY